MSQAGEPKITTKQREALVLLASGHTSKEIGQMVGVSSSAIDQRIGCIARAVGVADRRALLRWYLASSQQPTGETPQGVTAEHRSTCSKTDRNQAAVPDDTTAASLATQVILVPIPETRPEWSEARQLLEAALLTILVILGAHALLQVLV